VRGRRKLDGKPFYIVPGSKPGATYYTASGGCTCPSFRHRGSCKHSLAVADFERNCAQTPGAEHQPTASPTSWRPCSRGCGELLAPEHVGRMCDGCYTRIGRALDWIE
jgi:hypothetical protein